MSPGSSTESYSAFALNGLRDNPGRNFNQEENDELQKKMKLKTFGFPETPKFLIGRNRVATDPENVQATVRGLWRRQMLWFVYMLRRQTHNTRRVRTITRFEQKLVKFRRRTLARFTVFITSSSPSILPSSIIIYGVNRIRPKSHCQDRRKSFDEDSEQTNLSWSTIQRILTEDLHIRRVSAKFVPRLLTDDQRENRVRVCRDLMSEVQNDSNFLKKIVTGDESWCYGYDPESKQASSQWKTPNSPRPKKARQVRSSVKIMLICIFDVNGIVYKEFIPPGHRVNQHFYLDVVRRLRESVQRKRPELCRNGNWLLHHDNAPAHTALTI
ncbi:hypothetical protein ANN_23557 [Periplaneta americana]|uniref:Mariner transposase n=1 Tax=Periplaneta americana TaxID=6978 RepID=A0ABQ8SNH6_PERAM|nr:hypothetical protein ANN_23557 [Periplaneta americana]